MNIPLPLAAMSLETLRRLRPCSEDSTNSTVEPNSSRFHLHEGERFRPHPIDGRAWTADASAMQELTCPHCGEPLETFPDPGGGEDQDYVEDCAVCCRPIRFHARYDDDEREFAIEISAEP